LLQYNKLNAAYLCVQIFHNDFVLPVGKIIKPEVGGDYVRLKSARVQVVPRYVGLY